MQRKYLSLIICIACIVCLAIILPMLFFSACGDKNNGGNEDNETAFGQASLYQIVVPTGERVSTSPINTAAELLQEKLKLITGITLPIYDDSHKTGESKLIKIGFNTVAGKGEEGFQVKTGGGN
ncbi:MAG: hypothetical protein LBQ05_00005, partial [Christensenellaceae bacterium]|nr:hypothetical protein [Christensenellaceae bacterium]